MQISAVAGLKVTNVRFFGGGTNARFKVFTAVKKNLWFSGLLCRVVWFLDTNILEDRPTSIFRGLKFVVTGKWT